MKTRHPILGPTAADPSGNPGDEVQGFKFDKTNPNLRVTSASPAPRRCIIWDAKSASTVSRTVHSSP